MTTKTVILSENDAIQVRAILRTHAEMQDAQINPSMAVIGRLRRDEPSEIETIADLVEAVSDCEIDRDNLQRIADLFI